MQITTKTIERIHLIKNVNSAVDALEMLEYCKKYTIVKSGSPILDDGRPDITRYEVFAEKEV